MREYKFKGKNKDIGWVYGQLAYDINGNTYIIQEVELDSSYGLEETILFATMWHRVDKETVGQYTGLKDKKQKEIYEGDIIFIKGETKLLDIKGKVEYSNILAQFIITNTGSIVNEAEPSGDYEEEDIEVISNIYDNPELLEKGE